MPKFLDCNMEVGYNSSMRLELETMHVIGDNLALKWTDGEESFFGLEFLRRSCPCALCAGEKDLLGNVSHQRQILSPKSFQLSKLSTVGGYAIQPEWADGHASGIYSFEYLRSLVSR